MIMLTVLLLELGKGVHKSIKVLENLCRTNDSGFTDLTSRGTGSGPIWLSSSDEVAVPLPI